MKKKRSEQWKWTTQEEAVRDRGRYWLSRPIALAALGVPRYTGDLDILVDPSLANAKRLGAALADYGYPKLAGEWRQLAHRDRMTTLGREPGGIDIMTSISGVDFRQALDLALLEEIEER